MCSLSVVGWKVGTARHQQLLCALGALHESRLSGNMWTTLFYLGGDVITHMRHSKGDDKIVCPKSHTSALNS